MNNLSTNSVTNFAHLLLPDFILKNLATLDAIAVAMLLLAILFWFFSVRNQAKLEKTLLKARDNALYESPFKCVTFHAADVACRAARAFNTQPILLKDAPKLPLATCSADKCTCSLLRFEDRRTGRDRRENEVLDKRNKSRHANKRSLKDRRRESIQTFLLPKYRTYS